MKRVLVTGASGFVGRQVMAKFAHDADYQVTAISGHSVDIGIPPERALVLDFNENIDWDPLIAEIDVVIHLAGIAHQSGVSEELYERVNIRQTESLAKAAAKSRVSQFIFISSIGAQSGSASDGVLTESDVPRPVSAYGRSKLAAEASVGTAGVPFTIFRPVLVYGPGVRGNMRLLTKLAASAWPLPFGAFTNRRSLLAVSNLVDAIFFALKEPATLGELFIVSDPSSLTIAEVIAALRFGDNRPSNLLSVPPDMLKIICLAIGKKHLWDKVGGNLVAAPQKLISFGWVPKIDTAAGLMQMVRRAHRPDPTNSSQTAAQ